MITHSREHGFALVSVLCAAAILAIIVVSVLATSRSEIRLAQQDQQIVELGTIAGGALNTAILRLLDPSISMQPPVDATPFTVYFAEHVLRLTVQDEGRQDRFEHGPTRFAAATADLDGRRTDRGANAGGPDPRLARGGDRQAAERRESPGISRRRIRLRAARGPFETVEELKLVMGMTPQLFDALAPALTVYSQIPWVDPSVAPPGVLRALPGMDEGAIAGLLQARAAGGSTPVVKLGHAFTITVEADGPDALHVKRSAVIRLTGRQNAPIWVYRWD